MSLTVEERSAIVAALRADRQRFAQAEAEGKPAPRKKAIKEKPKIEVSLDDLLGSPQS